MTSPCYLYKYLPANVAAIFLEKGLSFSRVSDFWKNDPSEFSHEIIEPIPAEAFKALEKDKNDARFVAFVGNPELLARMSSEEARNAELAKFNTVEYRRFAEWKVKCDLARKKYVCSLTSKKNNMYMWENYAGNHTGIALEFSTKAIHDICTKQPMCLSKVFYQDTQPKLTITSEPEKWRQMCCAIILRKGMKFVQEDEYRIVLDSNATITMEKGEPCIHDDCNLDPDIYTFEKDFNGKCYIYDKRLGKILTCVVLGSEVSEEHREYISNILTSRYPSVRIECE